MSDITLTFLRISLLSYLERHGFSLSQKFAGVYYVSGIAELKIQIVVGAELEGDEFVPLRVQKENASEDDIRKFIEMCGELREQAEKDMAHTIIQISNSNNKELYDKILEEKNMSLAIDNLIADKLAAKAEESRAEGRREERADLLSRLQSSGMLTQEQIATVQNWQF